MTIKVLILTPGFKTLYHLNPTWKIWKILAKGLYTVYRVISISLSQVLNFVKKAY